MCFLMDQLYALGHSMARHWIEYMPLHLERKDSLKGTFKGFHAQKNTWQSQVSFKPSAGLQVQKWQVDCKRQNMV